MILFFDTETTGLYNKKLDYSKQPNIVQLAFILSDLNGLELASGNFLIKQDKPIPEDCIKVHGKTDFLCKNFGMSRKDALSIFSFYAERCDYLAAHNIEFDVGMLNAELSREKLPLIEKKGYCTAQLFTGICQLPPTEKMKQWGFKYKTPSLSEAYKFMFQRDFTNAHDALADVKACKELYFSYPYTAQKEG